MSILSTAPVNIIPLAADGKNAISGASWASGAWTEYIASTANPIAITGMTIGTAWNSASEQFELDFGIGAAGSEVVIGTLRWYQPNPGNGGVANLQLPIAIDGIPAGTRVAIRARRDGGAATGSGFALQYVENPDSDQVTSSAGAVLRCVPSAANHVSVTPSGSAWANSSWVELTSGLSNPSALAGFALAGGVKDVDYEVDIGVGGAGSETVITTLRSSYAETLSGGGMRSHLMLPKVYYLSTTSRIAVRMRKSGTSTVAWGFALLFYGDFVPPGLELARVTQAVLLIGIDEEVTVNDPGPASPCAGGGTVVAGSNPTGASDLTADEYPEFWMEIDLGGGLIIKISDEILADSTFREAKVLSWGDLERALPDTMGMPEASVVSVRVSDTDSEMRGYMDTAVLLQAPMKLYGINDSIRRAGGDPWLMFHGRVKKFEADNELEFVVVGEDFLTAQNISDLAETKMIPQRLIDGDISDSTPRDFLRDKPVPHGYGSVSDEDEDNPRGAIELRYVQETSEFFVLYGLPRSLNMFLGFGHAIKNIQNVYVANYLSANPTSYIRVPDDAWDSWIWAPGKPGWPAGIGGNYYDSGGKRYFVILIDQNHPAAILARSGQMPVRMNACLIEDEGDATGTMIDSMPRQFLHWLINFALQNYLTGAWGTIPSVGGFSVIDTDSWDVVEAIVEARLGAVQTGGVVIGWDFERHPVPDVIADWCRSGGWELFENRKGQLALTTLPLTVAVYAVPHFSDQNNILEGSFSIDPATGELENEIIYFYKQNYLSATQIATPTDSRLPSDAESGSWLSGIQSLQDSTSISDLGGNIYSSFDITMPMTRDAAVADDVAAYRLSIHAPAKGRGIAKFDVPITDGSVVELGDLIAVTTFEGTGSGWAYRICQVRRLVYNPDDLKVTIHALDVDDLVTKDTVTGLYLVDGDPTYVVDGGDYITA